MSYRVQISLTPANGEQLLNEAISPDCPGMLIDMAALDASNNPVTLSKGMIRFYASPFSSGNVWNLFDTGSYQGQVLRLKAVKSGIPGNVTSILVNVYRSNYPQTGFPDGAFTGKRALTIQDFKEAGIKNGILFTASRRVTGVAAGANLDSAIITGSKPIILLQRTIGYTGKGVAASIYRAATYSGGTAADIQNPNDINPAATSIQLLAGGTGAALDNLTVATAYSEGNASNQGQGNSEAKLGEPVIMLPNTTYVLRITSLDTAAQNVNAYLTWTEGYPDIPL